MKFLSLLPIIFSLNLSFAQTKADIIVGEYWSPEKDAKIQIFKVGNSYNGKLVWVKDPNRKDEKNPDAKLRNRSLMNLEIIQNFIFDKEGEEWKNGKIYDAKSGKTYSCKAWLNGKNLKLRGYVGISMLGRTEEFERIK